MRSQSFHRPPKDSHNFFDGFMSDYYSCTNLEKQQSIIQRKFSVTHKEIESEGASDKENLRNFKRIFCLPIGYQFNMTKIISELKRYSHSYDVPNLEHIKNVTIFTISKSHREKLIFLFDFGVVVLWSFEDYEENDIGHIFFDSCKYIINSKTSNKNRENIIKELEDEATVFYYKRGENFNIANRNKITIESNDVNEILSIAYSLAQHTILSHFEKDVANTIEETKKIPIEMRDKGKINLTKKEISQNIGLIFMRRSEVNLNSDILDTPDIFWNLRSEMDNYYLMTRKYLDVDKRVEILNRRMKILKELYDVMNNEIKTQGKFRLEWIVVYLIVIEIFVSVFWKMLVKDILKLY